MSNKLKNAVIWLLRTVAWLAVGAILELFLANSNWLNQRLLPWFFRASTLALVLVIVVALPLSAFKRCRGISAIAAHVASYVFFANALMWAVLLTLGIWGKWAVTIGLYMMVVGVVPIAMLATLYTGIWSIVAQLVVLTGLTIGSRAYARWIGDRTVAPVAIREYGAAG